MRLLWRRCPVAGALSQERYRWRFLVFPVIPIGVLVAHGALDATDGVRISDREWMGCLMCVLALGAGYGGGSPPSLIQGIV